MICRTRQTPKRHLLASYDDGYYFHTSRKLATSASSACLSTLVILILVATSVAMIPVAAEVALAESLAACLWLKTVVCVSEDL